MAARRNVPRWVADGQRPIAAAVMNAVVDSGPTESCGEEPSTRRRAAPPTIAHRPATAGSPATSAYAMTWGTRYAATVTPAKHVVAQPGGRS